MELIVGIDLGTTNSLCAIFQDGTPTLIPNVLGKLLTPSVVGVLEDGQVLVGEPAKQLRVTNPENCAWIFKRWMGTDQKIFLGGQEFSAIELSSLVLKQLKSDAQQHLGQPVEQAVITVPAYFNDHQRNATKLAGELAGLKVRRIINEPTAAALVYGFHEREAEKDLIVIDLGGGTFDVTIMEVFEGTLEIVSTAGETQLGGEDFTAKIAAWALKREGFQLEAVEAKHPLMFSRLVEQCESAKRSLVQEQSAEIRMPTNTGELNDKCAVLPLSRGTLLEIVSPLIERLVKPIQRALRDSEKSKSDLTDVILVGGATRSLEVKECIREMFNTEPLSKVNPDEVVALGAAIQGALINDDKAVDDMVMTDICPFTLGVEVVKEFGERMMEGYFCPVIHRNTTIPVSKEQHLSTIQPNQKNLVINVYQGEGRKIKDNLLLGSLKVRGLPPGPAGQVVHVRFTYDLNGILEVEAYVPEIEKKFNTVLTQDTGGMTQKELQAALKKMQQLKFYPRDEVRHKNLLLFAERVVGEVNPFRRDELEHAIDVFENALDSGDRDYFAEARSQLLERLAVLGFGYNEEEVDES